jgi:hypothetical protein
MDQIHRCRNNGRHGTNWDRVGTRTLGEPPGKMRGRVMAAGALGEVSLVNRGLAHQVPQVA